jgi:tRNA(Arg) A34 adenosine deaminase TadA
MTDLDDMFMARAVALSREKMQAGEGGPFGALVVKDGHVIAEGWNQVTSTNDPTAHAEVVAIRRACQALGTFDLTGATVYTSCEPCPMCLSAIYWARCQRILFANTREDAARIGFSDDHIYEEIPKALHLRAIPITQMPSPAAAEVFDLWAAKSDRVDY